MVKAILEFNLSDPDDAAAHRRMIKATEAYSVIFDFDDWLRNYVKHLDRSKHPSLEDVREHLTGLLNSNGIHRDDL